jgi:hypothetical protein
MENKLNKPVATSGKEEQFPGYPASSPEDDIYKREKEVPLKETPNAPLVEGMDVPGSELDDADEAIGEEDEENNSYSIGGDRHSDLDEN